MAKANIISFRWAYAQMSIISGRNSAKVHRKHPKFYFIYNGRFATFRGMEQKAKTKFRFVLFRFLLKVNKQQANSSNRNVFFMILRMIESEEKFIHSLWVVVEVCGFTEDNWSIRRVFDWQFIIINYSQKIFDCYQLLLLFQAQAHTDLQQ